MPVVNSMKTEPEIISWKIVPLNVHNAGAHLADYVEGWGPLWACSTFGFEDMNISGTLMDFCHGTGNVCRQVSSYDVDKKYTFIYL